MARRQPKRRLPEKQDSPGLEENAEASRRAQRRRRFAIFGLFLFLAGTLALERLRTYDEPLDRDIACYAVIGHELLQGRDLYTDLWDHKPPGIHLTYAAAELFAGYGPRSIYLLNVTFAIITMLGVYAAGRAVGAGKAGGLWAAAFWTVISADMYLQANLPNTEVMINACRIWAFALIVRSAEKPRRTAYWLIIGALFALASLYKQITVVTAAALVLTHLLFARPRRQALLQGAETAAVGVATWAFVFIYFITAERLDDLVGAVFRYNATYAGNQGANLLAGLRPSLLAPSFLWFAWPLALLTLAALAGLARKSPRAAAMMSALILATFIEISLPGKFFAHYYQFWMPLLCIGGGWGIALLAERLPSRRGLMARLAGGLALLLLLIHEVPFYRLSATEWSRRKCGEGFIQSAQLAREIDELLAPGETFFVWGSAAELYYHTRRRPPTAAIYSDPLRQGPMVEKLSLRALMDIEESPPELFIAQLEDDTILRELPDHPVSRWFARRYRPLPAGPIRYGYALFHRAGGALERRLEEQGPRTVSGVEDE